MQTQTRSTFARISAESGRISVFASRLGWIALLTRDNLLRRLSFGHRNAQDAAKAIGGPLDDVMRCNSPEVARLTERLTRYAGGEFDDFLDVETDISHLSPFAASVVEAVRRIPLGETQSYGQVAAIARHPRAARAVGRVMAQNRTPLVVPCHRVVGSGGTLGGFSAMDGLQTKRRLLELEATAARANR